MVIVRFFIVLIIMAAASPAYAQLGLNSIDKSANQTQANKFYEQCLTAPTVPTDPDTDQAFCACAATQMYEWLEKPPEKTGETFLDSYKEKKLTEQVLVTQIYAPCLYIPIFEIVRNECLTDKVSFYFQGVPGLGNATCYCVAQSDSDYFKSYAQPFLEMRYASKQPIVDPIEEIRRDTDYYSSHQMTFNRCFKQYKNKLR